MSFLYPTALITDYAGKRRRICIIRVRESVPDSGIMDEALYHPLGSDGTPAWVSVASLRPLMQDAEMLS